MLWPSSDDHRWKYEHENENEIAYFSFCLSSELEVGAQSLLSQVFLRIWSTTFFVESRHMSLTMLEPPISHALEDVQAKNASLLDFFNCAGNRGQSPVNKIVQEKRKRGRSPVKKIAQEKRKRGRSPVKKIVQKKTVAEMFKNKSKTIADESKTIAD